MCLREEDVAVEDVSPDGPAQGSEDNEHEKDAEPADVMDGRCLGAGAANVFGEFRKRRGWARQVFGVDGGGGLLLGVEALDPGHGIEAENAQIVAKHAVTEDATGKLVDVPGLESEEVARGDAGDCSDSLERDSEVLALLPEVIGEGGHKVR